MKKLSYLLIVSILLFSYSCSKDDEPKQEEFDYYNFRITLEFSGNYLDYDFTTLAQGTTHRQELFRNNKTNEEQLQLQTTITESNYEFETVNDAVGMIFIINSIYSPSDEEEAFLEIKIYRDNKLFHEESLTFKDDRGYPITWTHWDNKIIRVPEL